MGTRIRLAKPKPKAEKTLADRCAEVVGSWKFIGGQTFVLMLWISLNGSRVIGVDPYPFILLNLVLSTQAAFTGPILLMASNRQSEIDRQRDINHYLLDIHETDIVSGLAVDIERIARRLDGDSDDEHF